MSTTQQPTPMETRKQWAGLMREAAATGDADRPAIALVGSFTLDPVTPYLGTQFAALAGKTPRIVIGPYDQIMQTCFDWRSTIGEDVQSIVLLWRIEDFMRAELQDALRGVDGAFDKCLERTSELAGAVGQLRSQFGGNIVVSMPPFPHGPDLDVLHIGNAGGAGRIFRAISHAWQAAAEQIDNVSFLDLDAIQRQVGIEQAHDMRKWYLFRQPFTERVWQQVGSAIARILAVQTVAPKKCVVLDCDNTLWGGIIGEDGLGGIALGDDHPGSAFRDFQQHLLTLHAQGVMLALCSKNNEADVWEVFDKHQRMVLKREHISAHRINWQDKPSNIVELAGELNIGIDSMVFVDDSAIEIGHVNEALPTVETITVPPESAALPQVFAGYRGFDRLSVTAEDRARNTMMAQERMRRETAAKVISKEDFIRSLELRVEVFPVDETSTERCTQLINKTNQFNLTTRRRDLAEVAALVADDDWLVLAMRASDRFGDYGIVGVCLVNVAQDPAIIDTLLMSCRVLGRNVEESFLAAIAEAVRAKGKVQIVGRFIASPKNRMVAEFYSSRGFEPCGEGEWIARADAIAPWPEEVAGGLVERAAT